MKKLLTIVCLAISFNAVAQVPNTLVMNASRLQELKQLHQQQQLKIVTDLCKEADSLLNMKPLSVMEKEFTPVSGNKHDYMSQAPYFWYDSTKPNGLPYMRKDGVRNPEIYKITDRSYLGRLENATRILSLAWFLTGEEKYARKSASLLRTWFISEATKMNPHLEYGQAIPGINTGRGIGIIETVALITIADAASLLAGSNAWTTNDHQSLKKWYADYLNWLLISKYGMDEHKAKNNHGTWYYAQAIDFALFTDNKVTANELIEESKNRLDSQLTKEGKQPLELERTNGLGYSTMNLRGWFTVATLAKKAGFDLWNYKTKQGTGLYKALDWLMPYAMGEKKWEYQQISKYNKSDLYTLLLQAGVGFNEPKYFSVAKKIEKESRTFVNDILFEKEKAGK
ncbi:alginate lyase family protein [Lacibacter sp. H407]|uniref:alginate lyase family protein n=1 Tax=Lacibacter sp. H407 TaxID=3133423 RepID=UPI0030C3068A